jgi:hypothetical protein
LAPKSPNTNEQSSCQNIKTVIRVTNPQLPKYVIEAITSPKKKDLFCFWRWKKKLVDDIGEPLNISNNIALIIS